MRLALMLMGSAGVIAFGLVFALTFLSPIHVERAARGFIQAQIERQLAARLAPLGETAGGARIGRFAETLARRNEEEARLLRERLATGANAQVAAVVARMQDLGCECRDRIRQGLDAAAESRLAQLEGAGPQLRRIIEGRYGEIVNELMRDLRIFAGTNLLAFLLLIVLAAALPRRIPQLFVPAMLLALAALTVSAFYLFGQDWFFTILYRDYLGFGYGFWLLLVFGLFCDVALFKARVTTRLLDAVASIFAKAAPC